MTGSRIRRVTVFAADMDRYSWVAICIALGIDPDVNEIEMHVENWVTTSYE